MPNLIFDTPTPPSQSYSQPYSNNNNNHSPGSHPLLQTSLKPRVPFSHVTSTPGFPKSRLNQQVGMDDFDSTFSTSDFGGGFAGKATETYPQPGYRHTGSNHNNENEDPMHHSVGYGNPGVGMGMEDKQRFLDLENVGGRRKDGKQTTRKTTRVDEYSDATMDTSDTERSTSSDDDDLNARLGLHHNNPTSTPYPNHPNNGSKSAFDGMARELRKEFERIMDSGKKTSPYGAAAVPNTISPAQRRYSLQPVAPSNIQANPVSLPRGVPPKRASPMAYRTSTAPPLERRDSTPTTFRTFGQVLSVPRQHHNIPSPRFNVSSHSPKQQQQQQQAQPVSHALSPFQVSSLTAPSAGILPPNNTRATARSVSPVLQQQQHFTQRDSYSSPLRTVSSYNALRVPDITGLTEGLTSPSRVTSGPSSHRDLPYDVNNASPKIRSRSGSRAVEDPVLSSALVGLRKRLEALESENARSEAKVAELEDKLASRSEPSASRNPREDELVSALKTEIERLQGSIEQHASALSNLQNQQIQSTSRDATAARSPHISETDRLSHYRRETQNWTEEFLFLRDALGSLTEQVTEVKKVLEEVLSSFRQAPGLPHHHHPRDQDLLQLQSHQNRPASPATPSRRSKQRHEALLRSPTGPVSRHHSEPPYSHAAGYAQPEQVQKHHHEPYQQPQRDQQRASSAPPTNIAYRVQRQASHPFAHNEPLLDRAERILSNLPPTIESHATSTCDVCNRRAVAEQEELATRRQQQEDMESSHRHDRRAPRAAARKEAKQELPMQTVVSRALRDLEDDFAVHKKIYIELSEEYKHMDPATPDIGKRKILASHLKESIDVLELKADEIKRLYDLLHYRGEMQQSQDLNRLNALAQTLKERYA